MCITSNTFNSATSYGWWWGRKVKCNLWIKDLRTNENKRVHTEETKNEKKRTQHSDTDVDVYRVNRNELKITHEIISFIALLSWIAFWARFTHCVTLNEVEIYYANLLSRGWTIRSVNKVSKRWKIQFVRTHQLLFCLARHRRSKMVHWIVAAHLGMLQRSIS